MSRARPDSPEALSSLRSGLACLRRDGFGFSLPGVVAAGMEVKGQRLAIQLGFHFVFDLSRGDEHATEVAGDATSFAAPEANRLRPA